VVTVTHYSVIPSFLLDRRRPHSFRQACSGAAVMNDDRPPTAEARRLQEEICRGKYWNRGGRTSCRSR
jgi:hypothetical protein